ncbi:hypothetical protein ASE86_11740 [Sphingomonas sp. Leaf33]|uniref:hypothetical protein n=1 Tax=Sphingomonas sp. Leaf33 TaxID=1736215 RepID=UPI0006F984C3|nr:hypothetical protein [Sphingomonas sp. Leaf33]KQN26727.1 hypothetical protein ASE86_11740 [Sphingomonas sp. Leaf33]
MNRSFSAPFRDAQAAWARDGSVLLPLAGLAFFLGPFAAQLLLPNLPAIPEARDEAAMRAWGDAIQAWAGSYGGWYLASPLLALFGSLSVFALYLARPRVPLGGAMMRALALFPRYLLASVLVSLPMAGLLSMVLAVPMLLVVAAGPIFYIFGRTMLTGPVIVADAPIGAVAAIARSWTLTRGHGWMLAATYATIFMVPGLLGSVALSFASAGGGNPVIVAIAAGLACLIAAGGALLLSLVQVALHRRLARP